MPEDVTSAMQLQYPEDMELSRDKSMADVQGDAMYPFVYLQLGSAYAAMLVGGEGGREKEREVVGML